MKTGIKMMVTPEQRKEVIRIAKAHGLNPDLPFETYGDFAVLYTKNDGDCLSIWSTEWLNFEEHSYEEIDADLFIRTNGTCEEWKPEPGDTIMVWTKNEATAVKREFLSMTKDGKHFICHSECGTYVSGWGNAKPAPKDWTDLVSEDNPAICWVWDREEDEGKCVSVIKRHGPPYVSVMGVKWQNAKFIMWAKDAK